VLARLGKDRLNKTLNALGAQAAAHAIRGRMPNLGKEENPNGENQEDRGEEKAREEEG
jgi:hypothetical protein